MRIILSSEWNSARQLIAAQKAIEGGIKPGDLWGFLIEGEVVGVKANKASVRVYPPVQSEDPR